MAKKAAKTQEPQAEQAVRTVYLAEVGINPDSIQKVFVNNGGSYGSHEWVLIPLVSGQRIAVHDEIWVAELKTIWSGNNTNAEKRVMVAEWFRSKGFIGMMSTANGYHAMPNDDNLPLPGPTGPREIIDSSPILL